MVEKNIPCICGARMVKRTNLKTKQIFFGCIRFPECTKTLTANLACIRWMVSGKEFVDEIHTPSGVEFNEWEPERIY